VMASEASVDVALTQLASSMLEPNVTSPPMPPSQPPSSHIVDPVVASTIFAVITALTGVILLVFGNRFFRAFLGLTSFIIVGGLIGYVMIFHAVSLPWWASSLIAVGMGAGAGGLAATNATIGLVACAGVAGGIVAALPMRLLAPGAPGVLRFSLILATFLICTLLTIVTIIKCRTPDDEDEDSTVPLSASQRRQKKRAIFTRKVLKALITSILGAYFLVHAINQWWHDGDIHSLQAAALLDPSSELPECGTPCMGLVFTATGLAALGIIVQLHDICKKPPPNSELAELNEPMAPTSDRSAAALAQRPGRGCQSEVAQRMRFKYCGGRAASSVPTHTASSVTNADSFERAGVLPAGSNARSRTSQRSGGSGVPSGPSWDRPSADANPWEALGVPQASTTTTTTMTTQPLTAPPASPSHVQPSPAGAAWPPPQPPSSAVWPPLDED